MSCPTLNLEHISFTYLTRFPAITVYTLKQQLTKTHTNMTCHFIYVCIYMYTLCTRIDSVACPSPLKWKTNKSKIKFCFLESLSLQSELFMGTECQSSFISLPLSLTSFSYRRNPVKLSPCSIKKHKKYLKLNPPNERPLWQQTIKQDAKLKFTQPNQKSYQWHLTGRARGQLTNLWQTATSMSLKQRVYSLLSMKRLHIALKFITAHEY
jgi:hypothetical protein